jgi:hypothetical protein
LAISSTLPIPSPNTASLEGYGSLLVLKWFKPVELVMRRGPDTVNLELWRRRFRECERGTSYEQGIGNASVVVLAGNFFNGSTSVSDPSAIRLKYMGRLDLTLAEGDLDFRAPDGGIVAKIHSVAPNFGRST